MQAGLIKTLLATGFATSFVLGLSASALAQDVRVVVGGQVTPGVYGRVEIGTNPPPPVVNPRPVVITQPAPPVVVVNQPVVVATPVPAPAPVPVPVYMHVPPGHAKNWRKHCHQYSACSQPVYFVRSAEYDRRGQRHGGRDGERGGEHHGGRHGHGHH